MRSVFASDVAEGQRQGDVRRDCGASVLADAVLGLYVSATLFRTTDVDCPVAQRLREGCGDHPVGGLMISVAIRAASSSRSAIGYSVSVVQNSRTET
jgi:hypothetical protein